jgi:hypothetical protein
MQISTLYPEVSLEAMLAQALNHTVLIDPHKPVVGAISDLQVALGDLVDLLKSQ